MDDVQPIQWKPRAYMRLAVKFLLEHGAAGLFLDPGLGKTAITLMAFRILLTERLAVRMLVIAPLRPAYLVWPLEALKWLEFAGLRVAVLHGKTKTAALLKPGVADVYVINPEGLTWLMRQQGVISSGFFDVLCVDESSKFKNTQTERFKLLKVVLGCFKRRWILTGSPAANGLLDLFGQVYLLDLGRALGRFITHYRTTYFSPTGFGGYTWVPQKGAEKRIYAALAPLVLRMSEKDYLRLPPMTVTDMPIALPNAAMKTYHEMEHQLFVALDRGKAAAVNQAVALMKCRQICNGGLYLDNGGLYLDQDHEADARWPRGKRPWAKVHDAKTEAVVALVDELEGQSCLVAYEFDHDLTRLVAALPSTATRCVVVAAEANTRDRLVALQRRWDRGEIQVLLVQPQSIAHGLNLQTGGRAVIMHSLNYNYEDYDQLIRRVYRQGQKKRVFVYRLVARGTVDEVIVASLATKQRGQQALFTALHAYRRRQKRA